MTIFDAAKLVAAVGVLTGSVIAIESRYQKAEAASQEHQYLAAENEVGRLETVIEARLLELTKAA